MNIHSSVMTLGFATLVVALATQAEAGWGRYRVTTYYGTPSVPVVRETTVVRGAYRPVLVAPAPVVVAAPVTAYYSPPVTTYYSAPAVYVGPRGVVRAAYYAPAPRTYYYAPAPATYYYQGYAPGTVILP
jgi:hypothetical protein